MSCCCCRVLKRSTLLVGCCAVPAIALFLLERAEAAQGRPASASEAQAVDFLRDVRPILKARCFGCHGAQNRSGGLRLDRRMYAEQGGDSRGRILGGPLATNALYRRVASTDIADRMPKAADPLSEEELAVVRRWVEEGTPWTDPAPPPGATPPADEHIVFRAFSRIEAFTKDLRYLRVFLAALTVAQIVWLAVERIKRRARSRAQHGEENGRLARACLGLRVTHYLATWALLGGSFTIVSLADLYRQRGAENERLAQENERLSRQLADSTKAADSFGTPPVPRRPHHPRRLHGSYYRGNCERNPKLFNNGNYRTATFHLSLRDAEGTRLDFGSAVPEGTIFVEMELVRARGTTDSLFTEAIMNSVFLSETCYTQEATRLEEAPARLETLEPNQRWRARVPIADSAAAKSGRLSGLIYVYKGTIEGEMVRAQPHYGIQYDLVIDTGRLAEESDLWMESVYSPGRLATPQPDRVPLVEWFDWRPLPEIEGENSADPKLLGVEEHVGP